MMSYMRPFATLLCPMLLLTACGGSGQRYTAGVLNQRLQNRLAPDISAGRAVVQQTPDGARVTLRDPTMFSNSADALDNRENDVRASVVEALLDPSLMRVRVVDTSTLPDSQRDARVRNVVQYFVVSGLGLTLQPDEPVQAAPSGTPEGLTLTINVQCPDRENGYGYGYDRSRPMCN